MVFTVIEAASGLPTAARRRAPRAGPAAVLTRSTYPALLASAGFVAVEVVDRTAGYRSAQQRWLAATRRHETALRAVVGDPMVDERLAHRSASLAAIDAGVLVRRRYLAVAPGTALG